MRVSIIKIVRRIIGYLFFLMLFFIILCVGSWIAIYLVEKFEFEREKSRISLLTSDNAKVLVKSIVIKHYPKEFEFRDKETIDYFCRSFKNAVCDNYMPRANGGLVWRLQIIFQDNTAAEFPCFLNYSKDGRITGISFGYHAKMFDDDLSYYWLPLDDPRPNALDSVVASF